MKKFILAALAMSLAGASQAQSPTNTKLDAWAAANATTRGSALIDKLDWRLLAIRADNLRGARTMDAVQKHTPWAIRDGRLQVLLGSADLDASERACRAAGVQVVDRYDNFGFQFLTVRTDDIRKLDALADDAATLRLNPEVYLYTDSYDSALGPIAPQEGPKLPNAMVPSAATRVGGAENQAVIAMNADDAGSTYSVDGTGVRVGVISDSMFNIRMGAGSGSEPGFFTGTTDQVSGDLPASLYVLDDFGGGGSDEGNAMAQLIYDMAPGCDISFATAFGGISGFASNITGLWSNGSAPADVIVDDVGYASNPIYQDGLIAIAYEDAFANGVPCFSSAGNNRNNGHDGAFVDVNGGTDNTTFPPTGVDFHNFGGGDTHLEVSMPDNSFIRVGLLWNEPYLTANSAGRGPGSEVDLDLFVVSNTTTPLTTGGGGNVLSSSTASQGSLGFPAGDPYEFLIYTNTSGVTQTVYVVIDRWDDSKTPSEIHLFIDPRGGATITDTGLLGDRTMSGHNSATNVMGTAAMFYFEWDPDASSTGNFGWSPGEWNGLSSQFDVEGFSALAGNLPYYFDEDGIPITPTTRTKPDITAVDGCNTTFFSSGDFESDGDPNFFGTSAAAPNAASVAALVIERYRDLNSGADPAPGDVYSILKSTALKSKSAMPVMSGVSGDEYSGEGMVDALAAVAAVVATDPAPFVDSITRASASPTNASSVDFTVTFSESVTGVGTGNFAIDASGGQTGATISGVSGAGDTWTVSVNTVDDASGTVSVDLDDTTGIMDTAPQGLTGTFTAGEAYTIDRVDPAVDSVVRTGSTPTNAASVGFTVTFTETVTGDVMGDYTVNATGDQSGATVQSVSGSGTTRTVTVNTVAGEGTLTVDVATGSMQDGVGNGLAAAFVAGETYLVDTVAPDTSATGPTGTIEQMDDPIFEITFSESTTGAAFAGVELFYSYAGARGGPVQYPGGPFMSSPINFDISGTGGSGQYQFYTVGSDAAGNSETPPGSPDLDVILNDTSNVAEWDILD